MKNYLIVIEAHLDSGGCVGKMSTVAIRMKSLESAMALAFENFFNTKFSNLTPVIVDIKVID